MQVQVQGQITGNIGNNMNSLPYSSNLSTPLLLSAVEASVSATEGLRENIAEFEDVESPYSGFLEAAYEKLRNGLRRYNKTLTWADNFSPELQNKLLKNNEESFQKMLDYMHHHIEALGILEEAKETFEKLNDSVTESKVDYPTLLTRYVRH